MKLYATYAVAACLAVFLLYKGLQNQPDPLWLQLQGQLRENPLRLSEAQDSLTLLYRQFHKNSPLSLQQDPFKLVSSPFIPTVTWAKFKDQFSNFFTNHFALYSSITGSGATTLTGRIASLVASRPENLLEIQCAPQFDLMLHEKYIGKEDETLFQKGKMLLMWENCRKFPDEKFVVLVDNFDKINPETFFGPELWEKLDNPKFSYKINGEEIEIPDNFYFMAVIHSGASAHVELNNEHFKRLGGLTILQPEVQELLYYWADKKAELEKNGKDSLALSNLRDSSNLLKHAYQFVKTNELVAQIYGPAYQLGQWNNLRKTFAPEQLLEVRETFINHVNSLNPTQPFTAKDFKNIEYTLKNKGLESGSSFLAEQVLFLQQTGYFVEITMVGGSALLTALFGWWFYRRREKVLREYGQRTTLIFKRFEEKEIAAETAAKELRNIKDEVDNLVLERKLNYTEALYFLAFIDDKVRQVEFTLQVNETFLDLVNSFLDDGILSNQEYLKLSGFLTSIRHKIPQDEFLRYQKELELLNEKFR